MGSESASNGKVTRAELVAARTAAVAQANEIETELVKAGNYYHPENAVSKKIGKLADTFLAGDGNEWERSDLFLICKVHTTQPSDPDPTGKTASEWREWDAAVQRLLTALDLRTQFIAYNRDSKSFIRD